jgi:hypothetical protein
MKLMFLSLALLSMPVLMAEPVVSDTVVEVAIEQQLDHLSDQKKFENKSSEVDKVDNTEDDIFFDDGLELPPVPAPREISPAEAYLREFGISVLFQYVAAKIWLEHQWKALTSSPS